MTAAERLWERWRTRRQFRKLLRPQPPEGVVVATYQDGASAYVAAGALQAIGIRAFVRVRGSAASMVYGSTAPGPMDVIVRSEDEQAARRELR